MKKAIAAIGALAAPVVLIALVAQGSAQPAAQPTPAPTSTPESASRGTVCDWLDEGNLDAVRDYERPEDVRMTVAVRCPEHAATVDEILPAPTPTAAPAKEAFKAIGARDWKLIAKDPDSHKGELVVLYGQVSQFDSATGTGSFRAQVSNRRLDYWYSDGDNTLVDGDPGLLAGVVEGDVVRIYAEVLGAVTYDTSIGGTTVAPEIEALHVDIVG